jgi:hypothetical protein
MKEYHLATLERLYLFLFGRIRILFELGVNAFANTVIVGNVDSNFRKFMHKIFTTLVVLKTPKHHFFADFFGENIFKIIISVPAQFLEVRCVRTNVCTYHTLRYYKTITLQPWQRGLHLVVSSPPAIEETGAIGRNFNSCLDIEW